MTIHIAIIRKRRERGRLLVPVAIFVVYGILFRFIFVLMYFLADHNEGSSLNGPSSNISSFCNLCREGKVFEISSKEF